MAINEQSSPYFDDYDEDKLFHKILFKPNVAVQIRELNQIQSILQKQIGRFGKGFFKEGSMVVPGEVNYDLKYAYVKLTLSDAYADIAGAILSDGVTVTGSDNLSGYVQDFVDAEGTDPVTLYIKYEGQGDTGETPAFPDGDTISFYDSLGNLITTATVDETGFGSRATITRGIYFVDGQFALVKDQSVIIDKYNPNPSKKVGLSFTEEVITSYDDETLLDNSLGTPNYTAPGADRARLTLSLTAVDSGSEGDNFIELISMDTGEVEKIVDKTDYSFLADTLARRTYEESGDYTVENFNIEMREHPTDPDKIQAGLEPGKAYVRGYEIGTTATKYIDIDRARDTTLMNNAVTVGQYGNYIVVQDVYGVPDVSACDEIEFYDGAVGTGGAQPSGTKVATAYVRHMEQTGANSFNIYLFGLSGSVTSAVSVYAPDAYVPFTGTLVADVSGNNLYDSNAGSYIFQAPSSDVKTLLDGAGNTDTNFVSMRQFDTTSDAAGDVILTAGVDEIFAEYSLSNYLLTTDGGAVQDLTGAVTLGGDPLGKQVTISLGVGLANTNVRLIVGIIRQVAEHKTKTVQTSVLSNQSLTSGELSLGKADIIGITSIIDDSTSQDITDAFELDDGQRRAYYDIGKIKLKAAHPTPATTITVTFDYFQHGPGDYFSVDSYASIDYSEIPTFVDGTTEYRLSDCYDFRPRINDAGAGFSGTGSSVGNMLKPSAYITSDVTSYLSRSDKIFLDYQGNFGVVKGISSSQPQEPKDPDDSMILYKLHLNPYTKDEDDLEVEFVENRRYTMRDIGKIEKRVENLEYQTILNSLEKKTADQQIIDPDTGNNRFKNGFFADPFTDHVIGDFDYGYTSCSLDEEEGVLRPELDARGIDLELDEASSSNVVKTGSLVTLPYTDTVYAKQSQATRSINVNPYAVFSWAGVVNLNPSSDFWVDTRYRRPRIIFRQNGVAARPSWRWRWWATSWTGRRTVARSTRRTTTGWWWQRASVTTRRTTTISNQVVNNRLVSNDLVPWMRPRTIHFKATKMKPLTRVYPYFDDKIVSEYCRPDGGAYGGSLITDVNGKVEGDFAIPHSTFRTGSKEFKLLDNANGDDLGSLTTASQAYSAKGILRTRQKTIVSTMQTRIRRTRWVDPVAQSFLVDAPGGIFLTKIRLFFETKDNNVPVTVDIREMENGQPTQNIVPYSEVTLLPSQVNTSDDASVATDFGFESPVYLQEGTEYCFVVTADSVRYNIWISRMGERIVGTNQWVSKQPFVGVMFKSQNSSTWTASQEEDIKFELHRAKFTALSGTVSLKNADVEQLPLDTNPFLATSGSSVLEVKHPYHGFHVGSKVTYAGASTGAGIDSSLLNTTHDVVSVLDVDTYTIDLGTGNEATTSSLIGGDVMATSNIQYSTLRPSVSDVTLSGTSIDWTLNATTGKSISGIETPYQEVTGIPVINSEDIDFEVPYSVYNAEEETAQLSGARSFELVGSFASDKDNLSPFIDANRFGAIGVRNRINNPGTLDETAADPSTVADANRALSRYMNKTVTLNTPATIMKVWFDVLKPTNTDVKVYYRVLGADDGDDISVVNWTEMTGVNVALPSSTEEYYEEEHEQDPLSPFTQFQIKLVLLSSSEGTLPMVKNLRALALS